MLDLQKNVERCERIVSFIRAEPELSEFLQPALELHRQAVLLAEGLGPRTVLPYVESRIPTIELARRFLVAASGIGVQEDEVRVAKAIADAGSGMSTDDTRLLLAWATFEASLGALIWPISRDYVELSREGAVPPRC